MITKTLETTGQRLGSQSFRLASGLLPLGYFPKFHLASNFCRDVDGMKPDRYTAFVTAAATPGRITVFHDNQNVPDRKTAKPIDQTARALKALPGYFEKLRVQGFTAKSLVEVEALASTPQ